MRAPIILVTFVALGACAHTAPAPPAVEIRTVTKTVEVQKPCPVTKPKRPAPLVMPLPADPVQLAAILGAKLAEWSGPGKYGERVDAALERCIKP